MPLSWNEIRNNALAFSREWADARSESSDKQTFWNEFFEVFGLRRRNVATFEEPVRQLRGTFGRIDLIWPGTLVVEHKSRGESLSKAESQGIAYIRALNDQHRESEVPRYLIVSDFAKIALHDLENGQTVEFELGDLHRHIREFDFIPGYQRVSVVAQDPVNLKAVALLAALHDSLEDGGYTGHDLERFLVRILFCLFAEDTALFERNAFTDFILNHTREDGSDLGAQLNRLFDNLNRPSDRRQSNLLEELSELPYVNGDLFEDQLQFAEFNRDMRDRLLACCRFDWSKISPAVFGSLFQGVMEPRERRQIGGHYTSERDILKLVNSLFMDDLRAEFQRIKSDRRKLAAFQRKLGELKFLDPACGCGNFLVVTYRELRLLEIQVLLKLHRDQRGKLQQVQDIQHLSLIDVDAMHGIEISEFPARIAEVALWLIDHQMNIMLSEAFGQYYVRLPLRKSAKIVHANALRIDWNEVLPASQCSYVLGNPPFVGSRFQSPEQRSDLERATHGIKHAGILDYVTAWYFKASEYISSTPIRVAFVSTNSISQGEQVGVIWGELFRRGITIHFAHRTFPWASEARGKANVHVVIVGFGLENASEKRIYDYEANDETPTIELAKNINAYLVDGPNTIVLNRSRPICDVPQMVIGNQPIDDGNYLFTTKERDEFILAEPLSRKWFRRWLGADEFINGWERWCLWLGDCPPEQIRGMPGVAERVEAVKLFRLRSKRHSTLKLATTPTRFQVETLPQGNFTVIPGVSSERRTYIPIGFLPPETMVSNLVNVLDSESTYHFGILTSSMHMAWVRQVCGRLESRYRYSVKLVYNNFPWPQDSTEKQRQTVEEKAQTVLDVREEFHGASLADLYDPVSMPAKLARAHAALDKAVDRCYRKQPFTSERQRVEFLFGLYEQLTAPLTSPPKRRRAK